LASLVWLPATVSASRAANRPQTLIATKATLLAAAGAVCTARLECETAEELAHQAGAGYEAAELKVETAGNRRGPRCRPGALASVRENWKRALHTLDAEASHLGQAEELLQLLRTPGKP
jgi:hypothetical protein